MFTPKSLGRATDPYYTVLGPLHLDNWIVPKGVQVRPAALVEAIQLFQD